MILIHSKRQQLLGQLCTPARLKGAVAFLIKRKKEIYRLTSMSICLHLEIKIHKQARSHYSINRVKAFQTLKKKVSATLK